MASTDISVEYSSTARTVGVLVGMQLRRVLRAGIKSGRPALSSKAVMRLLLPALIAGVFAFNLYELAVHWLAGQPLGRVLVSALFRPVLLTAGSSVAILIV